MYKTVREYASTSAQWMGADPPDPVPPSDDHLWDLRGVVFVPETEGGWRLVWVWQRTYESRV